MALYRVEAQRTTYYEIELEANSPAEAERLVAMENLPDGTDLDIWAVDWDPVDVQDVEDISDEDEVDE